MLVEALKQVGDAAALEHDGAPGDLGGVRGEDGGDADMGEQVDGLGEGSSGEPEGTQGAAERAALDVRVHLRAGSRLDLMGEAPALAVVGFGEIDELEVEGEGASDLIGRSGVLSVGIEAGEVGLALVAAHDGRLAEHLDRLVDPGSGLLAEDLSEQGSEGTDVAAEGCGFEVAGGGEKFGEAVRPGGGIPQGRHE